MGETEYGFKAIPLGGYIRMIGMVPPGADGRQKISTTAMGAAGMVRNIVEETREGDRSQVTAADEGRQFYQLHPAKRIVVMVAGPMMNLILAVGIFGILMVGIGVPTPSTTVATVSQCVIPAAAAGTAQQTECAPTDPQTPAALAGLLPGDQIVEFDGVAVTSWAQLTALIQSAAGTTVQLSYIRDGQQVTKAIPIVENQRAGAGRPGQPDRGQAGRLPGRLGDLAVCRPVLRRGGDPDRRLHRRCRQGRRRHPGPDPGAVRNAIFNDAPRDLNSPVGIVGAGRIGGEILESDNTSTTDKWVLFLNLVAGFNMSLFLLNMLPLLPLDGGHILGAMIEWVKKGYARFRGKADPGPFDVAKLMPVAYVVALLFLGLTALTFIADIVNPVKLFG